MAKRGGDQILETIRDSHALVFLVDPHSLESAACTSECRYAATLGKPIVPILATDDVSISLLPHELSQIQLVDYRKKDRDAALHLARALGALPTPKPLPEPLPAPPEAPLSYLGGLASKVGATALDYEQQSGLVVELKRGLRSADTKDDSQTLLLRLRRRRDLFAAIAEEIDETLREGATQSGWTNSAGAAPSGTIGPTHTTSTPPTLPVSQETGNRRAVPTSKIPARIRLVSAGISGAGGALSMLIAWAASGRTRIGEELIITLLLLGFLPCAIAASLTANVITRVKFALVLWAIAAVVTGIYLSPRGDDIWVVSVAGGFWFGGIPGAVIGTIWDRRRQSRAS